MNNLLRITALFLFVMIQHGHLHAYNLRKITNMENLSNSSVTSLCQDKKGILWIGTCDGLNIYNGYKISLYQSLNKDDVLSGSLIDKITATDDNHIWVQTYYGIDLIEKEKQILKKYNEFNKILYTEKDINNNFYIIRKDSCIFYYDKQKETFEKVYTPKITFNNILFFFIDASNIIRIVNKDGSTLNYKMAKNTEGNITLNEEKGYQHVRPILYCSAYEDGLIFIDNEYNLYEFNTEKQKVNFILNQKELIMKNGAVSSIIKFHDDYFIGFKTNGLFRLKSDTYGYSTEKIPINSGIFCLLKDKYQDIIWIGTDGQGVYSYSNDRFSIRSVSLNDFAFNISRPIRAIHKENNILWLGSKGDGIVKIHDYDINKNIKDCKMDHISMLNSDLWDNSVYSFSKSQRNIIWIGTEEGLNYYSKQEKEIKKIALFDKGLKIKYIHDVYEQDSILWIATVGMGVVKARISWHRDTPELTIAERYLINNGDISSNYFFSFFVENKTIWIANRGSGLYKLNTLNGDIKNITFKSNTLDEINSIAKDNNGNYLIGTSFGLIKYKDIDDNYMVMNKTSGFPNNVIHCILPEEDGTFWLSTNNGIINYDSNHDSFRKYNYLDGLNIFEFSDGASFNDTNSGSLFFGGINGFISIRENEDYRVKDYAPPIYMDGLVILGEEHNLSQFSSIKNDIEVLTLNYDQNFFSVSFNAIDYLNRSNYNYQYKLEEINNQWVNNGNSGVISLTNFTPGEYTLLVKYHNMASNIESPIYKIKIKILPPWYRTGWSYAFYYLLCLVLIILSIRYLIIREKKKKVKALRIMEQKHKEDVYESKLRFFTNIAHEFCTPLTLIYGPCNRILNQKNIDKTIVKYTEIIQQNAERLNTLIQDLIEFRRIETGHKNINVGIIKITDLITHVANAFTDLAESRHIDFKFESDSDIVWSSDKELLITIISNLLSNAFKYAPDNGAIRIKSEQLNGELQITVSNIGKGIKQEDILKIFDRYSVLEDFENRNHSGFSSRNGLGLAISNSMVELLSGKIEIESQPNEWTHFIIKLPFLQTENTTLSQLKFPEIKNISPESKDVLIQQTTHNDLKPTLLIVDDEPEILWLIRDIFVDEFNVITAENAQDALHILSEMYPDIILCDIMMSRIDGIDFTKQVKNNRETAHIPLVLISAKHEVEKQIEGMNAGAELYITKPFNTDYLKTSVKQLISRKETLKDYFASPKSAYELDQGKFKHKEHKKFIKDILEIINQNIRNNDLSVQFIAEQLNMSVRSLYRKINEIDDASISEMIRECRLYVAKELLVKTKMTVEEIVFESGFANRVSFFKAFAKKYECTPKAYREKHS